MLTWLVTLWRRMNRWIYGEKAAPTYHRSNLHGRRR